MASNDVTKVAGGCNPYIAAASGVETDFGPSKDHLWLEEMETILSNCGL
jgi:hypothetical protein